MHNLTKIGIIFIGADIADIIACKFIFTDTPAEVGLCTLIGIVLIVAGIIKKRSENN